MAVLAYWKSCGTLYLQFWTKKLQLLTKFACGITVLNTPVGGGPPMPPPPPPPISGKNPIKEGGGGNRFIHSYLLSDTSYIAQHS
jgi:hypothetical protein